MILAINSSTPQFGLALLEEDGIVLAEYLTSGDGRHFGGIMPACDFLMESLKAERKDLQAVVVATGPGSFTGLRVGLAAAKGLSHGLKVPIIGISSLEAMASQLPYAPFPIAPILSSRRGEVFISRFTWKGHQLERQTEDSSLRYEDLPLHCKTPLLFIGNDLICQGPLLREAFGKEVLLAPPQLWNLKASSVGSLGAARFRKGDFDDPAHLLPIYLRPPDIRPNPYPSNRT